MGVIFGVATLALGQLLECDTIDITLSITRCANGEGISYAWSILSILIMVSGASYWILSNNRSPSTK